MDRNDISLAVVKRLPRYYRYLEELLDNGSKGYLQEISATE